MLSREPGGGARRQGALSPEAERNTSRNPQIVAEKCVVPPFAVHVQNRGGIPQQPITRVDAKTHALTCQEFDASAEVQDRKRSSGSERT
jgi:hypothetical protein